MEKFDEINHLSPLMKASKVGNSFNEIESKKRVYNRMINNQIRSNMLANQFVNQFNPIIKVPDNATLYQQSPPK